MSMTACITRVIGTEYKHARDLLAGDVRRKATFTLNIACIDVLFYWALLFNNLQMQLLTPITTLSQSLNKSQQTFQPGDNLLKVAL